MCSQLWERDGKILGFSSNKQHSSTWIVLELQNIENTSQNNFRALTLLG